MNDNFKKLLSEKCKDFGLTDKAIEELAKIGSDGIDDNTSEEELAQKVDSLVPFAKMMQGEITRKAQKQQPKPSKENKSDEGKGDDEDDTVPNWAKKLMKQVDDLKKENEDLRKADETKARSASIAAKAKELGIPDFLMKRVSFADDADFEKELTDYKQELVNAKLMPAESAGEKGSSDEQNRQDAETWAASLPNK